MTTLIKENDKALIFRIETGEYEVWLKLKYSTGVMKGAVIPPKDEDFGVRAWSAYSEKRAQVIFDEITSGERCITPMREEISAPKSAPNQSLLLDL